MAESFNLLVEGQHLGQVWLLWPTFSACMIMANWKCCGMRQILQSLITYVFYPGISMGRSQYHFRCNVCNIECGCSHMGKADVKRHFEGPRHQAILKDRKTSLSMQDFVQFKPGSGKMKSMEAQVRPVAIINLCWGTYSCSVCLFIRSSHLRLTFAFKLFLWRWSPILIKLVTLIHHDMN